MKTISFFFLFGTFLHLSCFGQDSSLTWLQAHQHELQYQQREISETDEFIHKYSFQFEGFDDFDDWNPYTDEFPGVIVTDSIFDGNGKFYYIQVEKTAYKDLQNLQFFEQIDSYQDSLSQLTILPLPTIPIPVIDADAYETGVFDTEITQYAISEIQFAYPSTNNDRNEDRETVLRAITHLMAIVHGEPVEGMMNASILKSYQSLPETLSFETSEYALTADLVDFDKIRLTESKKDGSSRSFAFYSSDMEAITSQPLDPKNPDKGRRIYLQLKAEVEVTERLNNGITLWNNMAQPTFTIPENEKARLAERELIRILEYHQSLRKTARDAIPDYIQ